ncbi:MULTISPECIES: hypothetical protein [unclassified Pseudoxanthomonas]|uniref:hypothetical protein n=1 Tax=unclassified Pseudoxanthomonas TaxID=2645906 RepID=UPI003077DF22
MSEKLSSAFDLVREMAASSGKYTADEMNEIAKSCASADAELFEDFGRFDEAIKMVELALVSGDEDRLVSSLINLRLASMAISTDWNNLTDSISQLFEKRAIRKAT